MNKKEKNFISAVVYVHNSEQRIEDFMKMLISTLEEKFEYSEIIIVNDHSADNSSKKIKEICSSAKRCSISLVNLSSFHGLETAINAGNELALGDMIFEFDSTIVDYDSEMIMKAYQRLLEGYDFVGVSPDRKEKISSRLFYKTFEKFTGIDMSTERFRVVSRRLINRVSSMSKTVPYRKEAYMTSGFKTDTLRYSPTSDSNVTIDKSEKRFRSKLASDSLILFTEFGYRFSSAMTLIMMLVSVFMIVYSIAVYATAKPVEGWTTIILFLSFAFFGLFAILTVIIKYLQIIVDLIFKRKQYAFESVEKLT